MCVVGGATFFDLPAHQTTTAGRKIDPSRELHEFTVLRFVDGLEADQQLLVMEALGHHLSRCGGLIAREFFCSEDGHWVEHVVWASQTDLEASAGIEEDAAVARLFDCFDTRTVAYARGKRVGAESLGDARPAVVDPTGGLLHDTPLPVAPASRSALGSTVVKGAARPTPAGG
jgi:hypothetical protein